VTRLLELSEPLRKHAQILKEWSAAEVRPYAREADTKHGPPDNWQEILNTCPVPISRRDRIDDGTHTDLFPDGNWISQLLITESLTYGDIWVSDVQGQGIGHLTVKLLGTAEQVERWYRPIVEKGGVAAFALTEPGFGSDTSMVATTAARDGDTWVLNGSKIYCSGGSFAEYIVVFANADKSLGPAGIRAFVVPKNTPGLIIVKRNEDKLGIRSWQTSELLFQDCELPLDHQLGWLGDRTVDTTAELSRADQPPTRSARSGALGALAQNKPNISAMGLGFTQASIDVTTEILKSQRAGFTPQRWASIECELERMNDALERIRRVNYGAQWLLDARQLNKSEASVSKAFGPPTFEKVIRRCMQLLGPNGTSTELLLEKWYRDCKILDIFEGSAQVQRIIIGRTLMGADAGRG
jgi:acyl-CoA dehydrogenase